MSDVDTFYMGVQVTKDGVASGASDLDASNATTGYDIQGRSNAG